MFLTEGEIFTEVKPKPCPVCGSREHPAPAVSAGETVTRAGLAKLRAESESAAKLAEKYAVRAGNLRGTLTQLEKEILADAESLTEEAGRDAVRCRCAELEERRKTAEAKYRLAKRNKIFRFWIIPLVFYT